MEKRRLGKSGLMVNPVGLGCMGFTHAYGAPVEHTAAARTIREAIDSGYDFIDTAECYIGTNPDGSTAWNETIVGEAVKGIRDRVIIATKCGVHHNPDTTLRLDSRPETIRASVEGSLKRLGIDCIDLYYQHRVDPNVDPETVASTMADLIAEGKIRFWGISEVGEEYLRRANAVCPVTAIQQRYSMMARWHEAILPVCEELDIAFVAHSPMANGFLTGTYKPGMTYREAGDYRAAMPQYSPEGYAKAKALLDLLSGMVIDKGATMSQLSLAWLLAQSPRVIPIPGSRRIERLRENFAAAEISFTADELARIRKLLEGADFAVFGGHAAAK